MAYQALEKLHQLHDGYRKVFRVGQMELLLVQEDSKLYLLENRCPHMDAPLLHGRIQNGVIQCPMHRICFDLRSGACDPGIPAPVGALKVFTPVYEGNTVGIET